MKQRASIQKIAISVLLIFAAAGTLYAIPDFNQILKEIDELGNFEGKDFSCIYTIVSVKPDEEKSVTKARLFRRDERDQFVILFLKPEVQKGQGYLQIDDNVWFYDPESRKFEKSTLRANLQDSDAQNSDLNRNSLSEDYRVVDWGEDTLGSFPVYVLDLESLHDDVSYAKLKIWVRKDESIILKEENYSVSDRLMRTVIYPKYTKLDNKFIPSQILVIDEINTGERSQLSLKEPSVAPIPDYVFTKAYLEQVNR